MVRLLPILALVVACGSTSGPQLPDAEIATITSVTVTPGTKNLVRGIDDPLQLSAMATLSNAKTKDATQTAMWASSDPTIATVDTHGLVTPVGPGMATVTATAGGVPGTAAVTVSNAQMFVTEDSTAAINIYDAYQTGNTAPVRQITGGATTLGFMWQIAFSDTELYIADSAGAIDVFPITATGNVAPTRRITGAMTTLASSFGITLYNNEIYATSAGKVLVFPQTGDGNIAPTRTITGPTTTIGSTVTGVLVDNGELYVLNTTPAAVLVFPVNATGDVAPTRTIAGTHTQMPIAYSMFVYHDELFVSTSSGIRVFPKTATGDVAPLRSINGPDVPSSSTGLQRLGHEMYTVNFTTGAVQVEDLYATSDAAPLRTLVGAATMLSSPRTLAFH